MVYVGSGGASADGYSVDPALIDPGLPVDWKRPEYVGAHVGYWPSYSHISPGARAAYLHWLIGRRCDPDAYIGYVFLYFYGLERRLLIDLVSEPEHPEVSFIANEVRRLLNLYGESGSFQSYAGNFLELIEATQAHTADLAPPDWTTLTRTWHVPAVVRIGLGRYVASGQPIPAEWALPFLRTHPDAYLRTPATRCLSDFDELFRQRYRAHFGSGLVVRPSKARIEIRYRSASGGMPGMFVRRFDDLPDICEISGPVDKLKDLAADCADSLDAYSRFLGRNPDSVNDLAAVGLLPAELLHSHGGTALDRLHTWLNSVTAAGATPVLLEDVVEHWLPGRETKLKKKEAVALASLLTKLGVGIEPDVRFGGTTPALGSTVVLFPLPENAPTAPSQEYASAAVLVHLSAVVASADGSVDEAERRHLAEHLEAALGLEPSECARLEAHLDWLTIDKPSLAGVKRRLEALDEQRRSAIGRFLIEIAAANGVVSPEQLETLTKLYKLLGLAESDVYSAVHALGTDSGPVTVRSADPDSRHAIPRPDAAPQRVQLDPAKVQARLAETATVTAMLSDIFAEDDETAAIPEPTSSAPPTARPSGPFVDGLDPAHSVLADRLRAEEVWDRAEAQEVAAALDLPLLDGALDRINEIAMDLCGEPLVEGDDPLEINDYAAQELFA